MGYLKKIKRLGIWLLLTLLAGQANAQSLTMQWSHAEAVNTGKGNLIKWTTAYEAGCKEYLVEKIAEGDRWQPVSSPVSARNADGPNEYEITDPSVTASVACYRVRKTDKDGKISYSVTLIAQKGKGIVVQLYAHPSTGEFVISAGQPLRTVQVFNAADSLMYITVMNGISYHTINSKEFAAGNYYAIIQLQDGNVVKEYFSKK
jgi:hypothetical protein